MNNINTKIKTAAFANGISEQFAIKRQGSFKSKRLPSLILHADKEISSSNILHSYNVASEKCGGYVTIKMKLALVVEPFAFSLTRK